MIARVELTVEIGMTTVENIDPNVIANMSGSGFQTTLHWKMLTLYTNAVVQDNLTDTDGFQLYTPIASVEAREDDPNIYSTKRNYKEEFERPPFIQKVTKPKLTRGNRLMRDIGNNILYEKALSNQSAVKIEVLNGNFINIKSHPTGWFTISPY